MRVVRKEQGQTLVVAVIILGVLLILGTAFAGIINRNIQDSSRFTQRTVGSDLAQAGVEYARNQLLNSVLGADWRPEPTPLQVAGGTTRDPDALYLRPADAAFPVPGTTKFDLGGPDGLGPYSRVEFERGRALVRVRYAPNDLSSVAQPSGNLRQPGAAQGQIVIEVVGRPGSILTNGRVDPSRQLPEEVRVGAFASAAAKATELGRLRGLDARATDTKRLVAVASIGLTEHARFITNKFSVSRPAEVGFPTAVPASANPLDQTGLGVQYRGLPVGVDSSGNPTTLFSTYGQAFAEPVAGASANWQNLPGGGSLFSNADLMLYGATRLNLNTSLGEMWAVNGRIRPATANTRVDVSRIRYDRATDRWVSDWQAAPSTVTNPVAVSAAQLDSNNPSYSTVGSLLRDRSTTPDVDGFPRGIGRKDPPSILQTDPQTRRTRYETMALTSGAVGPRGNVARFGYGRSVYVDSPERGNFAPDDDRENFGAVRALPSDWLNPNNSNSRGWAGPYYIPVAPYLRLLPDGFEITRDSRSRRPAWRNPSGGNAGTPTVRYRLRDVTYNGRPRTFILNSVQHAALVSRPAASLSDADFLNNGQPFEGVIYFEGDVRVRGIIPTNQQMTVVSAGTVYIEGSITKGVVTEQGTVLTTPSRSMLSLLARDHVALNTTMFFGPAAGQSVQPKSSNNVADTPNPVELDLADGPNLTLATEFLLNPQTPAASGGNPQNPSTWRPFIEGYNAAVSGAALNGTLLMTASADDDGPSYVGLSTMPLPYATPTTATFQSYLFPRSRNFGAGANAFNGASPFYGGTGNIPAYGLADPAMSAYPKFTTVGVALYDRAEAWTNYAPGSRVITATNIYGTYSLAVNDTTLLDLRLTGFGTTTTKNFLLARTAVTPHDVRIEAVLFAEEGSFYVIPGNWFNPNSADTREGWQTLGATPAERNQARYDRFGVSPEVPFYGEPLAVRVQIFGSITENMPAPMSDQMKWKQRWGWIPVDLGSTGETIPAQWVADLGANVSDLVTIPNIYFRYDPTLARGSADGVSALRTDDFGNALPPTPRLPISPTLSYYGEVNP